MRDQLRELEGQLAWVSGRIADYSLRDGKRYACISRPTIQPWDEDQAVDPIPAIKGIDHCWIKAGVEKQESSVEMYRPYISLQRIQWYSRKDGSIDLGFGDSYVTYNMDGAYTLIANKEKGIRHHQKQTKRFYEQRWYAYNLLLKRLKHHGKPDPERNGEIIYYFGYKWSITQWREWLETGIEWADIFHGTCKGHKRRPKKAIKSAGGFRDLL